MDWLEPLKAYAEQYPIVVLKFEPDVWEQLTNSKKGVNEFTIALPHAQLDGVSVPVPCLMFGLGTDNGTHFGVLSSKRAITTLQSRIKVLRSVKISPASMADLSALITDPSYAANLRTRLDVSESVAVLSPKLSSYLIEQLSLIQANRGGLRAIAEFLLASKCYQGIAEQQEDAVRIALAAFGLSSGDQALKVDLVEGKKTALARVAIMEDSVIEHDARSVPDYSLIASDITGRALFEKDNEQLEVFTANRRELEHCFGVDLIYINLTKHNVVMLQYKMLHPSGEINGQSDWEYRPDPQLDIEIARMEKFTTEQPSGLNEYRLNPQVFFMKFVKKYANIQDGGIIIPLDHFEKIRASHSFVGPRNGMRLSYETLNGSYLRQTPFLDLVKCGYIGAYAATTDHFRTLINEILGGNKAIVAAIQQKKVAA